MTAPSLMQIDLAALAVKKTPIWLIEAQREEIQIFGSFGAKSLGATDLTEDFILGYELGLATMRVVISGNINAIQVGVDV